MNAAGNTPDERPATRQVVPSGAGPVPSRPGAGGARPGVQPAQQVHRPAGEVRPAGAGLGGEGNRFIGGTAGGRDENRPSPAETAAIGAGKGNGPEPGREPGTAALLEDGELQRVVFRWREIQAHFVDEPRTAVERADALVADLMQQLAAMFARDRAALEQQWAEGDGVSTEELRQSLRRYRSLFERLLAA